MHPLIDISDPAGLLRLMDWLRPDFFAHRRGWPDLLTWRTDGEGITTDHRFVQVTSRRSTAVSSCRPWARAWWATSSMLTAPGWTARSS
ncbi:hypothetical protein FHR75_004199 [Kineococcus radiotolerans]|uniref:Uncharacterized protein n=1 Tax=Kineococcus radiotolerans TaxID=131568 RepID=A0A7W4TRG7_KINRA|nr:hypothetical protein [Kineococcus radiotolerans]MBB2903357.1 hypothetical protein [Kineococcus radiotolerans]